MADSKLVGTFEKRGEIMFKIEIKTSNSAFCNENSGEPSKIYAQREIIRILSDLVFELKLLQSGNETLDYKNLRDYNGNVVGKVTFK